MRDQPLEHVRVSGIMLDGPVRTPHAETIAQLGQEELAVGPLGAAGLGPAVDEP
jgi:hypothetical protein